MTAQVVKLREFTIEQMVNEVHKNFATERDFGNRADRARIRAGQLLLTLRERIQAGEAGNIAWWDWYKANITRTRRDAEKVMKIARAADPEEAAAAERATNREAVAKHEKKKKAAAEAKTDSDPDLIDQALELVEEMTTAQRQRFFAALRREYANQY